MVKTTVARKGESNLLSNINRLVDERGKEDPAFSGALVLDSDQTPEVWAVFKNTDAISRSGTSKGTLERFQGILVADYRGFMMESEVEDFMQRNEGKASFIVPETEN